MPGERRMTEEDEAYVVALCDEALGEHARPDHRFAWLVDDPDAPEPRYLPVSAYYPTEHLIVDYRPAPRPGDERRDQEIPRHGLALLVLRPQHLTTDESGRLRRDREADLALLRDLLAGARPPRSGEPPAPRAPATPVAPARPPARSAPPAEGAVTRAWQAGCAALAACLLAAALALRSGALGDSQQAQGAAVGLLAFGAAFDLYARALGALAARAASERGWVAVTLLGGSPAVLVHALTRRHGPLVRHVAAFAGLIALIGLLTALGAVAASG